MSDGEHDYSEVWHTLIHEGMPEGKQIRHLRGMLPSDPRCQFCSTPFTGVGGAVMRLMGRRQSRASPAYCNSCSEFAHNYPGGAEAEISMLFADVRGSTALAENLGPAKFTQLMNRFYTKAGHVLVESDAWTDRLLGDQVIGFYLPGFAGPDHARAAIKAAQKLLEVTGHGDPDGPWAEVGAGVHTDTVYFGVVGGDVVSVTALGDGANTTARLSSEAAAGEILISHAAAANADFDTSDLEERHLSLKGRSEPITVSVLKVKG